jgi:hypothetical protein
MAWDRYVAPFSYGLWLAVAIVACALGVCLALVNYGHERNQNLTVSAIFFYVHACFCQQGQTDISRHLVLFYFFLRSDYSHPYKPNISLNLNKIIKHIYTGNILSVSAIYFHPQRDIRQRYMAQKHPIRIYKTKRKISNQIMAVINTKCGYIDKDNCK